MTAVNLNKSISPRDTIARWMQRIHPCYPSEYTRIWEDELIAADANPVTDVYNVVFYCDPEYRCLRVMGMALYGEWTICDPFPDPIELEHKTSRPPPVVAIQVGNASMDELKCRIDWILNTHGEQDSPWAATDPVKEAITRQIVSMVPQEWEPNWVMWRARAERAQFERTCGLAVGESEALELMNGCERVQPTPSDIVAGRARYWWAVGAHEVDSQIMQTLPLYHDYKIHINYRQVGNFWALKLQQREKELKTAIWSMPGAQHTQLIYLSEYILDRRKERDPKRSKTVESIDIEDMILPPCMSSLIQDHFPKDAERQHLVRFMRSAKVPLERVATFLDNLNDQYPHPDRTYRNARQRWDYVAHYEKGYRAPNCDDMCDQCPYSGDTPERKRQCHEQFQEDHKDLYRPGDEGRFYNPASWIYWSRRIN